VALTINSEAEQTALLTIMNVPDMSGKLLGVLAVEHFGEDAACEVMARILTRVQHGRDVPNRRTFLMDPGLSDDARQYVENIQVKPVRTEEAADELVTILAFHRKIRTTLNGIMAVKDACKTATIETFATIESQVDQLSLDIKGSTAARKVVSFGAGEKETANAVIDRLISNDTSAKIMTGFKTFDERGGGLKRGDAFLIAGPTSGGKSAMANQLLVNMYLGAHHKTLMISFEMDEDECVGRLASCVEGVDYGRITKRQITIDDANRIQTMRDRLHEIGDQYDTWFRIWTPDDNVTASNVIAYARPMKPDVVVVDYIGLLDQDNPRDEQWKSMGKAMRQFKLAAKRLDCCFIVLAQFDQAENVVKYSRALKEHCSVMWAWQYGQNELASGIVTIRTTEPFGKNRNGERFDFEVRYDLRHMRITDNGPAGQVDQDDKRKAKQDGAKKPAAKPPKLPPGMLVDD
jgi:replicative DNA helicase